MELQKLPATPAIKHHAQLLVFCAEVGQQFSSSLLSGLTSVVCSDPVPRHVLKLKCSPEQWELLVLGV